MMVCNKRCNKKQQKLNLNEGNSGQEGIIIDNT